MLSEDDELGLKKADNKFWRRFGFIMVLMIIYLLITNQTVSAKGNDRFEKILILNRIVEAEATGEGLVGKELIAEIILNRVDSELFPNTIKEVVFHRINGIAQFSPVDDGRYYSVQVTRETRIAVINVLRNGAAHNELFFNSKALTSTWASRNREFSRTVGNHNTYN